MTHHRKPKGWAAVPGTKERAPIIEIVVFVVALAIFLVGAVGMVCGFIAMIAGAF